MNDGNGGGKMNGKSLVEMKIPVEEVENVDALVSEGDYGCRSDAIRDIIRRGACSLDRDIGVLKQKEIKI